MCAPTQADDIVLISTSRNGLNELLKLCNTYANSWRYSYNSSKCAVLIHNRSKRRQPELNTFVYENQQLPEVKEYKHLGITQNNSRKSPANVDTFRQTARGTLFSLINCGVRSNGRQSITAAKLYSSIVLPRALFGCELWNDITKSDTRHLESTHHFCLKRIQNLPFLNAQTWSPDN